MSRLTARQKAFANAPNEQWTPKIGDMVWVRRQRGNLSWMRSKGRVMSVDLFGGFEVALTRNWQRRKLVFSVEDLRPC